MFVQAEQKGNVANRTNAILTHGNVKNIPGLIQYSIVIKFVNGKKTKLRLNRRTDRRISGKAQLREAYRIDKARSSAIRVLFQIALDLK